MRHLLATALVAMSLTAQAQEITPFPEFEHFTSTKSRAQVKDEVMLVRLQEHAQASGQIAPAHKPSPSQDTRVHLTDGKADTTVKGS